MRGQESGKRTWFDRVGRRDDGPEEANLQSQEYNQSTQRWMGGDLGLGIFCGNG